MIKDNINRASTYYNLSDDIKFGFEWIKNNSLEQMPDGRYDISDNIYVNVQTYETKDDAQYEAHRRYIDIQYMIKGCESAMVTDYSNCLPMVEYNELNDVEFLASKECETYNLNENEFFVFFPHDAHKPSLKTDKNTVVKKAVIKVKIK